ncbi:MAG: hypothetical protein ABFD76_00930 [Smithella sp.]
MIYSELVAGLAEIISNYLSPKIDCIRMKLTRLTVLIIPNILPKVIFFFYYSRLLFQQGFPAKIIHNSPH